MDAYFLETSSPIASPTYVNHHRLSRYITHYIQLGKRRSKIYSGSSRGKPPPLNSIPPTLCEKRFLKVAVSVLKKGKDE